MPPRTRTADADPDVAAAVDVDEPAAPAPETGAFVRLDDPEEGGPAQYAIVVHPGTRPEEKATGPNPDPTLVVPLPRAIPYELTLYPAG